MKICKTPVKLFTNYKERKKTTIPWVTNQRKRQSFNQFQRRQNYTENEENLNYSEGKIIIASNDLNKKILNLKSKIKERVKTHKAIESEEEKKEKTHHKLNEMNNSIKETYSISFKSHQFDSSEGRDEYNDFK